MNNEFESILVSGAEIDKKLVAEILEPYLRIDKDTHAIRPLSTWDNLTAHIKILLFLVARKAMLALNFITEESASATEIMQETGMIKNTVNPALKGLRDKKIVSQTKERKYYIPNTSIEKVKGLISAGSISKRETAQKINNPRKAKMK
jgi:hypothetical protein